jgi:hypothetical protein
MGIKPMIVLLYLLTALYIFCAHASLNITTKAVRLADQVEGAIR